MRRAKWSWVAFLGLSCMNGVSGEGEVDGNDTQVGAALETDTDVVGDTDAFDPSEVRSLTGTAMKGPFLPGTTVTVYELGTDLVQTGRSFTATVASADGSWTVPGVSTVSPFVLVQVDGYFFDEWPGRNTKERLQLSVLHDLRRGVEVPTHLVAHVERPRIEALVGNGMRPEDAFLQAHTEFMDALGLTAPTSPVGTVDLWSSLPSDVETTALLLMASVSAAGSVSRTAVAASSIGWDLADDGDLTEESLRFWTRGANGLVSRSQRFSASGRIEGCNAAIIGSVLDGEFGGGQTFPVGAVYDVARAFVGRCPGGYVDCQGTCYADQAWADRLGNLSSGDRCQPEFACAGQTWGWESKCIPDPVPWETSGSFTLADHEAVCGPGAYSLHIFAAVGDSGFSWDTFGATPGERRQALWDSFEESFGSDIQSVLSSLFGLDVTVQGPDDLCIAIAELGNGTCRSGIAVHGFAYDGGDCLPLPPLTVSPVCELDP